jgi:hypothetical protein
VPPPSRVRADRPNFGPPALAANLGPKFWAIGRMRATSPAVMQELEEPSVMFRLITTVRRGSASDLAAAWAHYPTIDAARLGAAALLREDRVLRVMIVTNKIPRAFVEWSER